MPPSAEETQQTETQRAEGRKGSTHFTIAYAPAKSIACTALCISGLLFSNNTACADFQDSCVSNLEKMFPCWMSGLQSSHLG